jgi:hypothetical protein
LRNSTARLFTVEGVTVSMTPTKLIALVGVIVAASGRGNKRRHATSQNIVVPCSLKV